MPSRSSQSDFLTKADPRLTTNEYDVPLVELNSKDALTVLNLELVGLAMYAEILAELAHCAS
jgi:hypothetical protein